LGPRERPLIAALSGSRTKAPGSAGGLLLIYTDGFTEAESPTEEHGPERLCKIISRNWTKPTEAIIDAVVFDVRDFIDVQTIYDDLTLVVVKQK
jgi:sigma-B regulation protein RsbU (phosphoserine phosphatase)